MAESTRISHKYQRLRWEASYGSIPANWEFVSIGSLFTERNEKSSNTKLFPLYSFTIENGVTAKTDRYERSFLLKSRDENEFAVVYPGDFVLNPMNLRFGAIGFSKLNHPVCVSAYYNVLIPKTNLVDPTYIETFLRSYQALNLYNKIAIGSLIEKRRVHLSILERTYIPLPPQEEQVKIGKLLLCWNTAIEKTKKLLKAKEKRVKWLRQNVLTGKKRLAGCNMEWKKVPLRYVLIEHEELSTGSEEVCSVSVHKGVVNQVEHLGRVYSAKDTSKYNFVKPGDIIYTKSPTGDFPFGIIKQSKIDRNVIVSPLYGVFTPSTVYLGTILDCYFESEVNTNNYLRPIVQKGAKNTINITNDTFISNSLYLPTDYEEQRAIAEIINTARQEIELLKKQITAFQRQKRGLIQKLFAGEWRVKTTTEGI